MLLLSTLACSALPPGRARPPTARRGAAPSCSTPPRIHSRLVLVRHGQSEWNLANRFTGWVDVDLTERGITEAREAARLLTGAGVSVDLVVTSYLRRAIRTACIVLAGMDQCWVPFVKEPQLNEQHSGFLTGQNKAELAKQYGAEQVMAWRRSFDEPPPAALDTDPLQRTMSEDLRYAATNIAVPRCESLKDTLRRVETTWRQTLQPALLEGKDVLVVSHGNALRALVKLVDGVSERDVFHLDVPTAAPIVYELDAQQRPVGAHGLWGTSNVVRHGYFLVEDEKILQAQAAMRKQVEQNIAVSTFSSADPRTIATCDAYTAIAASETSVSLQGRLYYVRQRPPSYFALESERLERQAHQELASLAKSVFSPQTLGRLFSGGRVKAAPRGLARQRRQPGAKRASCALVLLRHGYSEYNERNWFTGWADCQLTNRGREEARLAGSLLRAAGLRQIDQVYCSLLRRSIKTAWLMLGELDMEWVPIKYSWRLNERQYGALQGCDKTECRDKYGFNQVLKWRRGVHDVPPPWDEVQRASTVDRRYEGVDVPQAESLAQCAARLRPFMEDELKPTIRAAIERAEQQPGRDVGRDPPTIVISSHENLIRAMVQQLDGLDDEQVPLLDIPYATPLVFHLDDALEPIPTKWAQAPLSSGWYMGSPDRVKQVQQEIQSNLGCNPYEEDCAAQYDPGSPQCITRDKDGNSKWVCTNQE
ncbi:hypothetical protein AB1Y20_008772 [Prymnesium parvum]|uniref:Phosphoglycerate mutase n=1 Tax=Prymnesium parvum TaxID=97485 RepID=A0AB34ITC4_PRYPA